MKRIFLLAAMLLSCSALFAQNKTVIAQVSDTQFGFRDNDVIDYEVKNYTKCVEEINALKPDVVVLTGDLVNHPGYEKQWKAFIDITGQISKDIPVYYIPGNHDVIFNKETAALEMKGYFDHLDYSKFTAEIGETYLIGIDSNPIKDKYGSKEEKKQFNWLKKQLKKTPEGLSPIIFTHHPFFLENFDEEEGYFQLSIEARRKYFDLFEKYGVIAVFSGHLHQNRVTAYKETMPVVTTSAIGVQLGEDQPGYRIITVENGKVSHEYIDVDVK